MEGRRRQKGENYRRQVQSKKPPRVTWQPTVPLWEKDFCRVVGSLNWETVLQMKKFTHLYSDVMNWNDSAGEEAFRDAKKRYWAEINGMSCDILLPDPSLYIDKIDWDSEPYDEIELLRDIECKSVIPNTEDGHDPVVIFGDSLLPNQAFSPAGWGDIDEKNYVNDCSMMLNQVIPSTGWGGDCERKNSEVPPVDRNWGSAWQFSGSTRYIDWGWNDVTTRADAGRGGSRGQYRAAECRRRAGGEKKSAAKKWSRISSCGRGTAIRVWNE